MVTGGKQPTARLHALCTLEGRGKLWKKGNCRTRIAGSSSRSPSLGRSCSPTAKVPVNSLSGLTHDPCARVRLELACITGQYPEATRILADLLLSDPDPWLQAAVMSSLNVENINVTIDEFSRVVRRCFCQ